MSPMGKIYIIETKLLKKFPEGANGKKNTNKHINIEFLKYKSSLFFNKPLNKLKTI